MANASTNLAFVYNQLKQHGRAREAALKAQALYNTSVEPSGRAAAAQNLAEAHLGMGELAQAEGYAEQVIGTGNDYLLPDGLRVLALVRAHQQRFDQAEHCIRSATGQAQKNGDRYLEAYIWRDGGEIYAMQHKLDLAEQAFERAHQLFTALDLPHEAARTLLAADRCTIRRR